MDTESHAQVIWNVVAQWRDRRLTRAKSFSMESSISGVWEPWSQKLSTGSTWETHAFMRLSGFAVVANADSWGSARSACWAQSITLRIRANAYPKVIYAVSRWICSKHQKFCCKISLYNCMTDVTKVHIRQPNTPSSFQEPFAYRFGWRHKSCQSIFNGQ